MSDIPHELDEWIETMLDSLSPSARARAGRRIGAALVKSNRRRMMNQTGPDGARWDKRKDGSSRKMMKRLRQGKSFKYKANADGVSVGWHGGMAAKVARVHHYGLRDRVADRGVRVRYAERPLIGVSRSDEEMIADIAGDMIGVD